MINEVKDALKERMSGGVLGTFSVFLITLNWKVWVYFFGGDTSEAKITAIASLLGSFDFICRIIIAAILTFLVLYFSPRINGYFKRQGEAERLKFEKQRYDLELELHVHKQRAADSLQKLAGLESKLKFAETSVENSAKYVNEIFRSMSHYQSHRDGIMSHLNHASSAISETSKDLPLVTNFVQTFLRNADKKAGGDS